MHRRGFILASGAVLVAGCDTTTTPQAVPRPAPVAASAAAAEVTGVQAMQIVDVNIVERRGGGRPFNYGGLDPQRVQGVLASKTKSALNRANPAGTRPTRADVTLSAIVIATKGGRQAAYDSVIIAKADFIDVATGQKVGTGRFGAQATYRPAFLGGADKVLSPEQELELITTHSTNELAKQVF